VFTLSAFFFGCGGGSDARSENNNYAGSENHPTLIGLEKKATFLWSTVKLLNLQTKEAQSERSNRVPAQGDKKSQRDRSSSLKQARAPGTELLQRRNCRAKLMVYYR
jgi:hypothetical protein